MQRNATVLFLFVFFAITTQAATVNYLFEGTVTEVVSVNVYPITPIVDSGIQVGDTVNYRTQIDFTRTGTETTEASIINNVNLVNGTSYHAEYLDGDHVFGDYSNVLERNWAWEGGPTANCLTNPRYACSGITVMDRLSINTYDPTSIAAWAIGDQFRAFDYASTDNKLYGGFIISDVVLTQITTIPVPATVWLFGSALIGLAGIKRKK